jgi:hypothetical protein
MDACHLLSGSSPFHENFNAMPNHNQKSTITAEEIPPSSCNPYLTTKKPSKPPLPLNTIHGQEKYPERPDQQQKRGGNGFLPS